jgi:anti-anti-sigma factor
LGTCAAWVELDGELDLSTAPQLKQKLAEALAQARMVVLDLRELSFVDAAGLHAILNAAESAYHEDRRLLVTRGSPHVHRVFTLSGVSDRLVIFDLGERGVPPAEVRERTA